MSDWPDDYTLADEAVKDCAESVFQDNPELTKSQAFAICQSMQNEGRLVSPGGETAALASFHNPGDIQRVEETGNTVRYKRVMLLSPGTWTDAGSQTTVDYRPEGVRASADNWVDMDAVRREVPDWRALDNEERIRRLESLGDRVRTEEAPINFLHGPSMYNAESLDEVGHVPRDSIIVDDEGQLYGDIVLDGDTPQSETAIELMDEVLEAADTPGADTPPFGPSVEIPADRVREENGVLALEEAYFSAVGLVFNPASRPVELGEQARSRAVAMQTPDDNSGVLIYRAAASDAGETVLSRVRHHLGMSEDQIDLDDLSDADLAKVLEATREDIQSIERLLQDLDMVQDAVERAESEGFDSSEETVADLIEFVQSEMDAEEELQAIQDAADAFLQTVEADSLDVVSAEAFRDWAVEQGAGDGDGEGDNPTDEEGEEMDGPTMEDLQNAKETIQQFNEQMSDVKDLLQGYRDRTESRLEELEKRLSKIEEQPDPDAVVERNLESDFLGEDGGSTAEHEDVML